MQSMKNSQSAAVSSSSSSNCLSLSKNIDSVVIFHHTMMEFFELCAGLIGSLAR